MTWRPLSPYQTRHIKRFGDYILTPSTPEPFDGELVLLIAPVWKEPRKAPSRSRDR
jgi:hypothetical protein